MQIVAKYQLSHLLNFVLLSLEAIFDSKIVFSVYYSYSNVDILTSCVFFKPYLENRMPHLNNVKIAVPFCLNFLDTSTFAKFWPKFYRSNVTKCSQCQHLVCARECKARNLGIVWLLAGPFVNICFHWSVFGGLKAFHVVIVFHITAHYNTIF